MDRSTSSEKGIPQLDVHDGSEFLPCFSTTSRKNIQNVNTRGYGNMNYGGGSSVLRRFNCPPSTEQSNNFSGRYFKSPPQTQDGNAINKFDFKFSRAFSKEQMPTRNVSTFTQQKQGYFPSNRHGRKEESSTSTDLPRGPRSRFNYSRSGVKVDNLHLRVHREGFNKSDFKTNYEKSRFYIIKSFSEDDIHKSIKYSVWTSTKIGNMKLDSAFLEEEAKSIETDTKCPIFLFFSVNASGQFVGIAEMIGRVDFNKNLDFWQAEIWGGFFPVKWHIIKDVPNSELHHIIIDDNYGSRDVTFTRDTHEIGLKQGVEMLNIFKRYVAKTSILDDFNFYESREKSLHLKRIRSRKRETSPEEAYDYNDLLMHQKGGKGIMKVERINNTASLDDLANSLSLNDHSKFLTNL